MLPNASPRIEEISIRVTDMPERATIWPIPAAFWPALAAFAWVAAAASSIAALRLSMVWPSTDIIRLRSGESGPLIVPSCCTASLTLVNGLMAISASIWSQRRTYSSRYSPTTSRRSLFTSAMVAATLCFSRPSTQVSSAMSLVTVGSSGRNTS